VVNIRLLTEPTESAVAHSYLLLARLVGPLDGAVVSIRLIEPTTENFAFAYFSLLHQSGPIGKTQVGGNGLNVVV